jgi:hypothetical protein
MGEVGLDGQADQLGTVAAGNADRGIQRLLGPIGAVVGHQHPLEHAQSMHPHGSAEGLPIIVGSGNLTRG